MSVKLSEGIVIALIGVVTAGTPAFISGYYANSAAESATKAVSVATGKCDFDLIGKVYHDPTINVDATFKQNCDEKGETDCYFIHQTFSKAFDEAPLRKPSVSGVSLHDNARFALSTDTVTREGFDVVLQVWHDHPLPDDLRLTWIAVKKDSASK